MNLIESMTNFVGGGKRRRHRSRRGKHRTRRVSHRRSRGKRGTKRKGGLSSQLVPLGLLASLLAVGPKKRKHSRRKRKQKKFNINKMI